MDQLINCLNETLVLRCLDLEVVVLVLSDLLLGLLQVLDVVLHFAQIVIHLVGDDIKGGDHFGHLHVDSSSQFVAFQLVLFVQNAQLIIRDLVVRQLLKLLLLSLQVLKRFGLFRQLSSAKFIVVIELRDPIINLLSDLISYLLVNSTFSIRLDAIGVV